MIDDNKPIHPFRTKNVVSGWAFYLSVGISYINNYISYKDMKLTFVNSIIIYTFAA